MSVHRFVGKTSRAVLKDVRATLGDDAVIISNRTTRTGVEVVAMAGTEMEHLVENANTAVNRLPAADDRGDELAELQNRQPPHRAGPAAVLAANPMLLGQPETFEAYLKRARGKQLNANPTDAVVRPSLLQTASMQTTTALTPRVARAAAEYASVFEAQMDDPETVPAIPYFSPYAGELKTERTTRSSAAPSNRQDRLTQKNPGTSGSQDAARVLSNKQLTTPTAMPAADIAAGATPIVDSALMSEMQSMKGMLQNQLAHFAFADMSRKNPVQGKILAKMLHAGFSPALTRALTEKLTPGITEAAADEWIAQALRQNLRCAKPGEDMVDRGGIYALVGPTGVGKTTTTAKLAARCAIKYGVKKLGLITIDGYRMGAQDQLKSFGKILGCPVHVAHDQASLNDLLMAMRDRHLVLIDTVGMPQRDPRMNEQLGVLMGPGIERVMVLNAAAQTETLEDVVQVWSGPRCRRALITKIDEAVKLGGVVDAAIRHHLLIDFVANGQRVPEDIHAANASLLVHRALKAVTAPVFQFKADELAMMAVPMGVDAKGVSNA